MVNHYQSPTVPTTDVSKKKNHNGQAMTNDQLVVPDQRVMANNQVNGLPLPLLTIINHNSFSSHHHLTITNHSS